MSFRDEIKAAHSRAGALEQELADAKRENARLREKLGEATTKLADVDLSLRNDAVNAPEPLSLVSLIRRANRAILLMSIVMLALAGLMWLGHAIPLPQWLSASLPMTVATLGVLVPSLITYSLILASRSARAAGGRARGARRQLWAVLPAVFLIPGIGTLVAGIRAVFLLRETPPSETEVDWHDALRPAASLYIVLGVCWPLLVVTAYFTAFGSPASGTVSMRESWQGRVQASRGALDIDEDETCDLIVTPASHSQAFASNCRVDVSCGEVVLFQGLARCVTRSGSLLRATTQRSHGSGEGPSLDVDIGGGYVSIEDSGPRPFSVAITLAHP